MKLEFDADYAAEILIRIRMKSGLSQNKFAEACGVTPSSVSHWENGVRFLKITRLSDIADRFGYKISISLEDK